MTLTRSPHPGADRRRRPRIWHHDFLHLRPLARDLETRITEAVRTGRLARVLDLGSGPSPYRCWFGESVDQFVRLDLHSRDEPTVVARAEAIPFSDGSFDAVLASQILGLVENPVKVGREIARIVRPGGRVWLTCPAAWPYDSSAPEHRFGAPDLPDLLPGMTVHEVVSQGGMLALPFAVLNQGVREIVLASERRVGWPGRLLQGPATVVYLLSNIAGRCLEGLAGRGVLSSFLGYLDARMPMNFLLVAEKNR